MMFYRRLIHVVSQILKYIYYSVTLGGYKWNSYIERPLRIDGGKRIFIGYRSCINYKTWLAAMPLTGDENCKLVIDDGCAIGHFNHIYATKSIILHKNVLTADKVYISDNLHGYEDVDTPILQQPIIQNRTVEIGEGSWLGENVCVIGSHIGKHCVIGANSVVTHDIPDYCVAVGIPAKVIKYYDFNSNSWKKVDAQENTEENMGGVKTAVCYLPHKFSFKKYHHSDVIKSPIIITPQYIELGESVYIGYHARIEGVSRYNGIEYTPKIVIHDNVSIQQNIHLTCANSIEIGDNTAVAANVTITDIHHPYTDVNIPIERQDLEVSSVIIGKDCKIYNNAVILPGTHIGNHVTIGANSVVSGDFPDYCVIVGTPAKMVKRYDFSSSQWRKTDDEGHFKE